MKLSLGSAALAACLAATPAFAQHEHNRFDHDHSNQQGQTTTPIKHVVVIFDENISFDHYFGTYPKAKNPAGVPQFHARADTPSVNGLTQELLTNNPNKANPQRLPRSQAVTCDNNHGYKAEQNAFNGGLMNKFVQSTGCGGGSTVMDYYDGNTVTAMWNYAQHFAMSDNTFDTTFGPSAVGHINLISGQTHGAIPANAGGVANGTVIGNPSPKFDDCANPNNQIKLTGQNIGDLLNDKKITWGWFSGGFKPTARQKDGSPVCDSSHMNIAGATIDDYIAFIEPFQFYKSTSNPAHLPPSSVRMIGHSDQANHQYDLDDFWKAAKAGNMPAVSFLKPSFYQSGHASASDPLDEQHFLVHTINRIQRLPQWKHTAIIIAYDDSDGWYDHVMGPIISQSSDPINDTLDGSKLCGQTNGKIYEDRCGYGPRQPLLVISPYAKTNFVAHSVTDTSSILRFIEDNWQTGRIGNQSFDAKAGSLEDMFAFGHEHRAKTLFLDAKTGEVVHGRTLHREQW
ncbi:alkaline phosphatase family protein [Salinisphaera sp. SWV1]